VVRVGDRPARGPIAVGSTSAAALASPGADPEGGDLYDARLDGEGCARYVDRRTRTACSRPQPGRCATPAATDRPVVASGGITELADLEALTGLVDDGVEGAIIGTALYEGRFTLEDALALTLPAERRP
jgi:phosphoribosylanthranilate isomerase